MRRDRVAEDLELHDHEWARREGLVSFAGFPLVVDDRLIGAMAVFWRKPLSDETIDALRATSDQLALGIDRDRAAEARNEQARFRELFIAILGHDLRNPLGAIDTTAETLLVRARRAADEVPLSTAESERSLKALQRIKNSASRMGRMNDQILDFTRLRVGGGLPINRTRTDLRELSRAAIEEVQLVHPRSRIEMAHHGDLVGLWDPDRLSQVVSNLVGNAVTHGAPGAAIRVWVEDGGDEVILRAHNTGSPIDPAMLPPVFDPFRRATHRKTVATQGLGLGLYIHQGDGPRAWRTDHRRLDRGGGHHVRGATTPARRQSWRVVTRSCSWRTKKTSARRSPRRCRPRRHRRESRSYESRST